MKIEDSVLAKLWRLPERERTRLLTQIEQWIEQIASRETIDIQRGLTAVARSWATIRLKRDTLRWIAESKDLEYEID